MMSNNISVLTRGGAGRAIRFPRRTEGVRPPEAVPEVAHSSLASKVADMFDYLRKQDYNATIECTPAVSEVGIVLQLFLDIAGKNGVSVYAQLRNGSLVFQAQ